jgi:HNH endonuclease
MREACSEPGCKRPRAGRGLCGMHYMRAKKIGKLPPPRPACTECSVPGCTKPPKAKGLCNTHYERHRKGLDLLAPGPASHARLAAFLGEAIRYTGSSCLLWPFGRSGAGYSMATANDGRRTTAHRIVCEVVHGPAPSPRHEVAHTNCRSRACIAPTHLRWDTPKGNQADRVADGTSNRGERQGRAKLTAERVTTIRAQPERRAKALAIEFGVSTGTISGIRKYKTWRHI